MGYTLLAILGHHMLKGLVKDDEGRWSLAQKEDSLFNNHY